MAFDPTESGHSFRMIVGEGGETFQIEGTVGSDGEVNVLKKTYVRLPR